MQLPSYTKLRPLSNALSTLDEKFGLKTIFAIDTFSLILFAMAIIGLAFHFPTSSNTLIQSLFAAVTLFLIVHFARQRHIGMIILKLSMLCIVYFFDYFTFLT